MQISSQEICLLIICLIFFIETNTTFKCFFDENSKEQNLFKIFFKHNKCLFNAPLSDNSVNLLNRYYIIYILNKNQQYSNCHFKQSKVKQNVLLTFYFRVS